ncbi:NPC intracellular cholesterol transporter 2-like [Toxorhynchites rutilus septentrionalis]|uniref:NPC intracellular cholesterol transporter 2-like n=1 Tax=Toxorhynchites rutilus septentrionalis TaxID=329112 RepID=UPI0024783DF9|nr:NPC intracellular cholesterol transporter 2-like [Toxorhynchites rutilus septentrionalis]
MFKYLLLVALVPALAQARTPVRQCGNRAPLPEFVDINGCTSMPCQIRNGETLDAVGEGIVSPVATTRLLTYINVRVGIITLPITIPPELEDACLAGIEPGCPLAAGQRFNFRLLMEDLELPNLALTARVEVGMRADDGTVVSCVEFDARVVR